MEVIDFDRAVDAAVAFYRKHPEETLIVVTGDHETGGMTVGHTMAGYTVHFEVLNGQKTSIFQFLRDPWKKHKESFKTGYDWKRPDNLSENPAMTRLLSDVFGITVDRLSAYQKKRLEDAYDKSMCGQNNNSDDENAFLYGYAEPIAATVTRVLNESAGIGWTTFSHTAAPVPVFAIGSGSNLFNGFMDNTDIAKKLIRLMGFSEDLPVVSR
jgi:alkaline phosphatase